VNWPGKTPSGVKTNALVDFSDLLPTFADLAGSDLPKEYQFDGKSFKDLILGKQEKSDRDWILTMGSRPAKIENGKVVNIYKFRDRALRDEEFKVFVDTLKQITEIYDLKNDIEEVKNLIDSKHEEVQKALMKFRKIVDVLPSEDNQPNYTKLSGSLYDISPKELDKIVAGRNKNNHAPKAEPKANDD